VRDRDAEPHPAFQLALVSKRSTSSLARASDDAAAGGQGVPDVRRPRGLGDHEVIEEPAVVAHRLSTDTAARVRVKPRRLDDRNILRPRSHECPAAGRRSQLGVCRRLLPGRSVHVGVWFRRCGHCWTRGQSGRLPGPAVGWLALAILPLHDYSLQPDRPRYLADRDRVTGHFTDHFPYFGSRAKTTGGRSRQVFQCVQMRRHRGPGGGGTRRQAWITRLKRAPDNEKEPVMTATNAVEVSVTGHGLAGATRGWADSMPSKNMSSRQRWNGPEQP
jgi:hypothetical protein